MRAIAGIAIAGVVGAVSTASGQVWSEQSNGGGDAGQLLTTAQVTVGTGGLVTIGGTIFNPDLDIDLYCIQITDHLAFSASVNELNQGRPVHLWLFDAAGKGVAQAADSTVPYTPAITGTWVPGNGIYYIGVSRPGFAPSNGVGSPMFPPLTNGTTPAITNSGVLASWSGVGCCSPGPYAIKFQGADYHDPGLGGTGGPWWTYTNTNHFASGNLFNVEPFLTPTGDHCIRLVDDARAWPYVGIANSSRGTLVRIAVQDMPWLGIDEGDVLGEYLTSPDGMNRNPSRTTVDGYGNIWVGNRNELGPSKGQFKGSVTRIGLAVGGTRTDASGTPNPAGGFLKGPFQYCSCEDRDGDGLIRTSLGYPHTTGALNADYVATFLAWTNLLGADSDGGVSTAEDECITAYVRTEGTGVRHVAIDGSNDVWVGGWSNRLFEQIDGSLATQVPLSPFSGFVAGSPCGGYGGLVDSCGVVWSATFGTILRYDPATTLKQCFNTPSYGMAFDPATCNIWSSYPYNDQAYYSTPTGTFVTSYAHGSASLPRGLVVDNGSVWVAHSGSNTVGRIATSGAPCGNVTLFEPANAVAGIGAHGVAVDTNGMIWTANNSSNNAMRINPGIGACGAVDLAVDLGSQAQPYNYSDMTGQLLLDTAPQGSWTFIHDSGSAGTPWGTLDWTAILTGGSQALVRVRASNSPVPSGVWTDVLDAVPFTGVVGRYLQVQVTLKRGVTKDPQTGGCKPSGEAIFCDIMICEETQCEVEVGEVVCEPGNPAGLNITMTVTNNTGITAQKVLITPKPIGSGVSFVPNTFVQTIGNTQSFTFSTTAFGWTNQQQFCFLVTLLDETNKICCTTEVCVTPECDCLQIRRKTEKIVCDPITGQFTYTFVIDNLTTAPIFHAYFFPPSGVTFTPNYVAFPGGVPGNGGSSPPITVVISGAKPGEKICFEVTIHDENLVMCCGRIHCITLPDCFPGGGGGGTGAPGLPGPDSVHLTLMPSLECSSTAMLTVINTSAEARSFDWAIMPEQRAGTTFTLASSQISPNAGTTVSIAPGKCVDIPVQIVSGPLPDEAIAGLRAVIVHRESGFAWETRSEVRGATFYREDGLEAGASACASSGSDIQGLTLGVPSVLTFNLTNRGASTQTFDFAVGTTGAFLRFNGGGLGVPATGAITLDPGQTSDVSVEVLLAADPDPRVLDVPLFVRPQGWTYPPALQPVATIAVRLQSEGACYVDCDMNGALNIFDFICFGNAYGAGQPYADCDGNGALSVFDYICFGNLYAAGCP